MHSSSFRHTRDFLAHLEGEYWQKRIDQLKFEFANSHLLSPGFVEQPQSFEPLSSTSSLLPESPAHYVRPQPERLLRKPPVARPIIRRDRYPSRSSQPLQ